MTVTDATIARAWDNFGAKRYPYIIKGGICFHTPPFRVCAGITGPACYLIFTKGALTTDPSAATTRTM